MLQWLLSMAPFPGNSQIVFAGNEVYNWNIQPLSGQQQSTACTRSPHISYLPHCLNLQALCLTLHFSQWSQMKPFLQARRKRMSNYQVPFLFIYSRSLPHYSVTIYKTTCIPHKFVLLRVHSTVTTSMATNKLGTMIMILSYESLHVQMWLQVTSSS